MRPARLARCVLLQAGVVLLHRLEQFGTVTLEQRPPQPRRDVGGHVVGKERVEQRRKFLAHRALHGEHGIGMAGHRGIVFVHHGDDPSPQCARRGRQVSPARQ